MDGGTYGATGSSFVLHDDPEAEDEYDYLPIPEGGDEGTAQSAGGPRLAWTSCFMLRQLLL